MISPGVSIHAPREGCDTIAQLTKATTTEFQFTHPGRGATASGILPMTPPLPFQFTHPGRGATPWAGRVSLVVQVSIHAPREGCDPTTPRDCARRPCFNSRTPGGVRPLEARQSRLKLWFQFTHPGRGATSALDLTATESSSFNSRTPGGVRRSPRRGSLRA